MDLTCNIPKKNNKNLNSVNADIINEIKKINLLNESTKLSKDQFYDKIKSNKYISIYNELMNIYFSDSATNNLGFIILMAYYISGYTDKIFTNYKSSSENKLILAANKVVVYIEKLLNNANFGFDDEFYLSIDHYYSLYKLWESNGSIKKLCNIFDEIIELNKIKKYILKNNNDYDDKLMRLVQSMFNYNPNYTIHVILHNYEMIGGSKNVNTFFWDKVSYYFNKDRDTIFLIIIAELRNKLIFMLKNPSDRKDLYYNIDIENIINKIRNHDFSESDITSIITVLLDKVYIIKNVHPNINKEDIINNFIFSYNIICGVI